MTFKTIKEIEKEIEEDTRLIDGLTYEFNNTAQGDSDRQNEIDDKIYEIEEEVQDDRAQLSTLKEVLKKMEKRAEELSKVPDNDYENKGIANLKLEELGDWINKIKGENGIKEKD